MLVEFASAVDAARCSIEIQRALASQNANVQQNVQMQLRIGVHVGDIIIEDHDIFGDGVNIAARHARGFAYRRCQRCIRGTRRHGT